MCLVVDDKCEMNASELWNISFVRGVLFYVDYLLVFVKLYSLDFQTVCVLFAFCLLCIYHQDYILEPHKAFVSCSSKSSC